jgi:hypothetical protein
MCEGEVANCGPEWFTCVEGVQELLPHLDGEPPLRPASEAGPRGVVLRFTASVAVAAFQPAGQGAVRHLRAAPATLRIGKFPDLVQLLQCPRRPGYQPQGEPPPDDRRRHIACCGGLAYGGDAQFSPVHLSERSDSPLPAP